jgi:ATP-binding cassette, subfamily B, bacterial
VAVSYLLVISWQMTVAALVLTPLALFTLKFAGGRVQAAVRREWTRTARWPLSSSRR